MSRLSPQRSVSLRCRTAAIASWPYGKRHYRLSRQLRITERSVATEAGKPIIFETFKHPGRQAKASGSGANRIHCHHTTHALRCHPLTTRLFVRSNLSYPARRWMISAPFRSAHRSLILSQSPRLLLRGTTRIIAVSPSHLMQLPFLFRGVGRFSYYVCLDVSSVLYIRS